MPRQLDRATNPVIQKMLIKNRLGDVNTSALERLEAVQVDALTAISEADTSLSSALGNIESCYFDVLAVQNRKLTPYNKYNMATNLKRMQRQIAKLRKDINKLSQAFHDSTESE